MDASNRSLAYARLQGIGKGSTDYYVRTLSDVTLGRQRKKRTPEPPAPDAACENEPELGVPPASEDFCELRGANKSVSSKHAMLYWSAEHKCWMIQCIAEKGFMCVDGLLLRNGMHAVPLKSKSFLEIGGDGFFFLTASPPFIYTADIPAYEAKHGKMDICTPQDRKRAVNTTPNNASLASAEAGKRKGMKLSAAAALANLSTATVPVIEPDPEWTKKEVAEFMRVLFILGPPFVKKSIPLDFGKSNERDFRKSRHPDSDDDDEPLDHHREIADFALDWKDFRKLSYFERKSDEQLELYFDDLISACRAAMRTGKTKRDQHAEGCGCVICQIIQKRILYLKSLDGAHDAAARLTGWDDEKPHISMTMIRAQKLRVRLSLIEAACMVETNKGKQIMRNIAEDIHPALEEMRFEMPTWWDQNVHDEQMMQGVARYGVGVWDKIWADLDFDFLDSDEKIPNTVAMKRFREVAGLFLNELDKSASTSKRRASRLRERMRAAGGVDGAPRRSERSKRLDAASNRKHFDDDSEESLLGMFDADDLSDDGGSSGAENSGDDGLIVYEIDEDELEAMEVPDSNLGADGSSPGMKSDVLESHTGADPAERIPSEASTDTAPSEDECIPYDVGATRKTPKGPVASASRKKTAKSNRRKSGPADSADIRAEERREGTKVTKGTKRKRKSGSK
ncbi:hypothetical protein FVE85_0282 [Porphyridium purpureum]|uniref:FHA domain-containing protein n=1 Tax=Porphyridium purpureum TaxID=35688 RepID=A0A5J4Z123_PORPP|nr:hypothetical protein FVE85_0282 [Porphyridium purpureum]|eukprot:POR5299..scf208_2